MYYECDICKAQYQTHDTERARCPVCASSLEKATRISQADYITR